MKYVYGLSDGRCFIPDTIIMTEPRLIEMLRLGEGNYWQRHECLDGWVSPMPDER